MPARPVVATPRRRPPIAVVVFVLSIAMVLAAAMVLIGGGSAGERRVNDGQLRDYPSAPEVAWELSSDTLPGYETGMPMRVADIHEDQWLLAYPRGFGAAYQLVDKHSGVTQWTEPIVTGLGSCAFTDDGTVGCAVNLGDIPDGFYLVRDGGSPEQVAELAETAAVTGVGENFLRVDQPGYHVTLSTPTGDELWSRTFATAATGRFDGGQLIIATSDGNRFVLDPDTGEDLITCEECDVQVYDTGITVQHNNIDNRRVEIYPLRFGNLETEPVTRLDWLQVVPGPSTRPVLTAVGEQATFAVGGRYEVRNLTDAEAEWNIGDPELSKVHAKPCGSMVSFARLDSSRATFTLDGGDRVGDRPPFDRSTSPNLDIDALDCVGSSKKLMIFANTYQLTAFDMTDGSVAWERPIAGAAHAVDGYLVLQEGTALTVLRPAADADSP